MSNNVRKMTRNDFVKYLEEEEIQCFEVQNIKRELALDNRTINEIVENMVYNGFLLRIERGKYCRTKLLLTGTTMTVTKTLYNTDIVFNDGDIPTFTIEYNVCDKCRNTAPNANKTQQRK